MRSAHDHRLPHLQRRRATRRARLFRDKESLAEAAAMIKELGYGRRNEELADAEKASKSW